jgi:hypothetical protein
VRYRFFAAFTQAALKRIPASTYSNRTVVDYHGIGSRRHGTPSH